ncbi:hypothetical protein GCM10023083_02100 [Streptomyces phyllanthi]
MPTLRAWWFRIASPCRSHAPRPPSAADARVGTRALREERLQPLPAVRALLDAFACGFQPVSFARTGQEAGVLPQGASGIRVTQPTCQEDNRFPGLQLLTDHVGHGLEAPAFTA